MAKKKTDDALTTSEAPETIYVDPSGVAPSATREARRLGVVTVDDGTVEVTLQGLGAGTSPWRVTPDADGGIPRVITVGGDTYDLADRAAKVYTWRHR